MQSLLEEINFKNELVPAVVVDKPSGEVLTLCYLNPQALRKSIETGILHLYRRSRGRIMKKGESSGHIQEIEEIRIDCAGNSLLIYVQQKVAACHKGYFSCYYRSYNQNKSEIEIADEIVFDPDSVY